MADESFDAVKGGLHLILGGLHPTREVQKNLPHKFALGGRLFRDCKAV